MSNKRKVKRTKFRQVLRMLGWQNYMNGIVIDPAFIDILTRKELKQYLKGKKMARKSVQQNVNLGWYKYSVVAVDGDGNAVEGKLKDV
jgi:hypothetical protein